MNLDNTRPSPQGLARPTFVQCVCKNKDTWLPSYFSVYARMQTPTELFKGINRQQYNVETSDPVIRSNCSPLKRKCNSRCCLKKTNQLGKWGIPHKSEGEAYQSSPGCEDAFRDQVTQVPPVSLKWCLPHGEPVWFGKSVLNVTNLLPWR